MKVQSIARGKLSGGLLGLLVVALAATAMFAWQAARAADHRDSPITKEDPAADINDVYAFRSLENPDNLVVALTVNPLTAPAQNASTKFASGVSYNIHVDNTGDLVADATVVVTFSADGSMFTVNGLGAPISGPVSANTGSPSVTEAGGIKVFAGLRDDPFFFDLVGFQTFVAGPYTPAAGLRPAGQTPADTFAGTNVSIIALELPITALTGAANSNTGVIKAWASTSRGGTQVDRMAIPAINTALIPSDMKDAFNQGSPATDEAAFRPTAQATIEGLRAAVLSVLGAETGGPLGDIAPAGVASALIPDIVTIDFSATVAFPNGRRLQDDVIDAALGIVLNRGGSAGIPDAINGNDKTFLSTFPYAAAPHQPSSVGAPSTGSGIEDGGADSGWMVWMSIAAAIVAVGGLGYLASRQMASRVR